MTAVTVIESIVHSLSITLLCSDFHTPGTADLSLKIFQKTKRAFVSSNIRFHHDIFDYCRSTASAIDETMDFLETTEQQKQDEQRIIYEYRRLASKNKEGIDKVLLSKWNAKSNSNFPNKINRTGSNDYSCAFQPFPQCPCSHSQRKTSTTESKSKPTVCCNSQQQETWCQWDRIHIHWNYIHTR